MGVPTEVDRHEALRRLLTGVSRGDDPGRLADDIAELHVRHNTFPGEVFMELAADALDVAGFDRSRPIEYRPLLAYLPERPFRGKEHQRIQYAVLTAFAVRGGLEPDLLDGVTYWIEQYWEYALLAAVAIFRAAAERTGTSIAALAAALASRHGIDLD